MVLDYCENLPINQKQLVVIYYNSSSYKFHVAIHDSQTRSLGLGWLKSSAKKIKKIIDTERFNLSTYKHNSKNALIMEAVRVPNWWHVETVGLYDNMKEAIKVRNREAEYLINLGFVDLCGKRVGNKPGINPSGIPINWGKTKK